MNKVNKDMVKEVRRQPASIILGKNGITNDFIEEVKRQIKRKKMIKIKALRSVLSEKRMDEIASEIAAKTKSRLLETRGYTMLLSKGHI